MPALEKERLVAARHPDIPVSGGVADDIGLGLNDAPARDAIRQFSHDLFADEVAGEGGGVFGQVGAGEAAMGGTSGARFQDVRPASGIRSTHCARDGPGANGSQKYWVSRLTLPPTNSMMLTV